MKDIDIERELRDALQRVEPGKDFSTIAYASPFSKNHIRMWRRPRVMMTLAAAVLFILLIPAAVIQYRARQKRGEEARAQLVTALRITGSKLQKTRQLVVRGLNRRNSL